MRDVLECVNIEIYKDVLTIFDPDTKEIIGGFKVVKRYL